MDADHHGSSHHGEPATKRDPTTNNSPAAAAVAATAANAPTGMEMDLDVGAKVDRGMEMEVDDGQGVGVASADAADEAEDDDAGGMGASHLQVQAQVIPTLSNGQSVGVQSDKVTDLGPETAVLDLPSENVTHVCWNPRDPTLLATGGDALCRIWSISTSFLAHARSGPDSAAVGPEANRDINSALTPDQNIDLLEVPEAIVTAMAWSPDGDSIAVAMHPESSSARGTIVIKSKTGEHLDYLPGGQDWVLDLHWNPSGSLLLGVTHSDDTNSVLMVWDIRTGRVIEPFHFDHNIIDVAWVDNRTLALCGPSFIASTAVNDHNLEAIQQFADSNYSHDWSFIRHDDIRHSIAIVSEHSGFLALLEEDPFDSIIHTISYIEAHDSGITDLMYQPVSNPAALDRNAPRMLATAGNDGKVKLWDARRPMGLVRTLDMGGASPALALSFTCDGYLVAAASYNKVLFWNAETGGLPKATWTARNIAWPSQSAEHAHQSNGNGNGNHENEDTNMSDGLWTYSLSWDADGHKLAFGAKDKVSFISSFVNENYSCSYTGCDH